MVELTASSLSTFEKLSNFSSVNGETGVVNFSIEDLSVFLETFAAANNLSLIDFENEFVIFSSSSLRLINGSLVWLKGFWFVS